MAGILIRWDRQGTCECGKKRRVYYKDVEFVLYISWGGLFCGGREGGENITQRFMCHIKNIKRQYILKHMGEMFRSGLSFTYQASFATTKRTTLSLQPLKKTHWTLYANVWSSLYVFLDGWRISLG